MVLEIPTEGLPSFHGIENVSNILSCFPVANKKKRTNKNKSQHHQSKVKKIARKTNNWCLHRLQNQ